MISISVPRHLRQQVIRATRLSLAAAIILSATSAPVLAHGYHAIGHSPYQDFLLGLRAVTNTTPVLLGLIAAGLFSGICKPDGFLSLWPFYLGGIVAGAAVGFFIGMPARPPAYLAAIAVGLLGAAAPAIPIGITRVIFFGAGLIFTNALFSGYAPWQVPVFAFVGVAIALNVGVAVPSALVWISCKKLPYGWVIVTWRASASWVVAIALMALVLMIKSNP